MIEEVSPISAIKVEYDSVRKTGKLTLVGDADGAVWSRFKARLIDEPAGRALDDIAIELPWVAVLGILREYGTKRQQEAFRFRFTLVGGAEKLAREFADEVRLARQARNAVGVKLSPEAAQSNLYALGFARRLREFQLRDLVHLLAMQHGANFSVPGAGKTTVTLALHMLLPLPTKHLFVIGPKASFPAWRGVVEECMNPAVHGIYTENFTVLDGGDEENQNLLTSGATRFLISYDLMIRQQSMLAAYFSRQPVHLVLDEAHRMKAGSDSQRGAFLLQVAPFVARRDILTGTPMPQGPQDIASQLGFLWPGQGMDLEISRGSSPKAVLGNLYARTTKSELGLPTPVRHFIDVAMAPGQQALYGIVRNETLRQLAKTVSRNVEGADFLKARRSIMRLLQLSANPLLALKGIADDYGQLDSGVVDAVVEEGASSKFKAVTSKARALAAQGRKVVIWTIFTESIRELSLQLSDLNPVNVYGAIPSGSENDPETREGRLRRFHVDPACMALIANPAAAGEGISLHRICHDAIYVDRSYVSTHYLQSIDRIHRLGLDENQETNIYVYRTKAPAELGSVDYSVSRRLATKIRGLQVLLDDPDLNDIALDEEQADDPVDYSVDLQDMVDLIEELEGKNQNASNG